MIKAGIIGSTGYAGENLVWILCNHPQVEIIFINSHSYVDVNFNKVYGNYNGFFEEKCISLSEAEKRFSEIDVLFVALPSGKSIDIVKNALENNIKVIDLGADFRLKNSYIFQNWYQIKHNAPSLLESSVYGLPELEREKIKNAKLLANPGCYPTASILALAPLIKNNVIINSSLIIDAKSGVSGAGRSANVNLLFAECNESIKAYGVATHRHTPEIEQELSSISGEDILLTFTPHLIPMNRGILSTCYGTLSSNLSQKEIMEMYFDFYKEEYFVKVIQDLPETRWVKGSNQCHMTVRVDARTNRVIVISAIDNLMKGAAGQAVQNMNIMFGMEEKLGLEFFSQAP